MHVGGYLSTVGMFSTVLDIMINVGDILSTVLGVQYRGGKNLLLFEYPHGTQIIKDGIPHGTHNIPHMHHDIPHGTQGNPPVLMISSHIYHDIPSRF